MDEDSDEAEADRLRVARRVALNVRAARIARQLTQEALAERVGCSSTYVQGVERGVENFTARMLGAFARGLAVDVARLFDRAPASAAATRVRTGGVALAANRTRRRA